MPCNSDYLAPNGRELALQQTAQLLEWVREQLGMPAIPAISRAAQEAYYCTADYVPDLCALLRKQSPMDLKSLTTKPNQLSRDLGIWYRCHILADEKREREEEARRAALSRISDEDKKLLGLN